MARRIEAYEPLESTSIDKRGDIDATPHVTAQPILSEACEVNRKEKYMDQLLGLGIAECMLGVASITLGVASFKVKTKPSDIGIDYLFTYTAQGIWGGFMILVTGIFGICAKSNPSLGIYNGNIAISVITVVSSVAAIVLSVFASAISSGISISDNLVTIHICISIVLFIAFVIVIVHSRLSCAGVCRTELNDGIVLFIAQAPQSQQVAGLQNVQVDNSMSKTITLPVGQ